MSSVKRVEIVHSKEVQHDYIMKDKPVGHATLRAWCKAALEENEQLVRSERATRDDLQILQTDFQKQQQELAAKDEALAWYADAKNYRDIESAAYSAVVLDEGDTARSIIAQYRRMLLDS